mgnify:CR=1 FL=1
MNKKKSVVFKLVEQPVENPKEGEEKWIHVWKYCE